MSETHSQPFRAQKSTKIVTIPTRQDTKSGQRIVRWKDVQQCFENAKTIMNGEDIVLFLTDDDLEDLIPLRIAHHPGVVLEVVTQDGGQDELSARRGATSSNDRRAHENQALSTIRIGSMARDVDTLGISDIDDYHALVAHSRDHTLGTPIRRISSSMDVHQLSGQRFDQPLLEMDPTTALRNELQQLRNQTEQTQRQMKEVQHKMQQETKKGKCNLGIKILIVFLCFGVFHFFFSFSSQQSQQVADDVIRSAQQSDHQLHYSEQLLQQHIDEALQKMQLQEQMDGVLQKVNDAVKNLEQLTLQKQLLNDMMEEFKKSNTKIGMDESLSQAFRAKPPYTKVIAIPTRYDHISGQRIVRWKDVQHCFHNAKAIINGKDVVLFLTDSDLEDLMPLRIPYHPGVILDVVTQDVVPDEATQDGVPDTSSGRVTTDGDDNQTSVVSSRTVTLDSIQLSRGRYDHPQLELVSTMTLQEEVRQLKQQAEQARQQMKEMQKAQQEDKDANRKCNAGTAFLVFLLYFGFLHFFFSISGQQSQQLTDEVIRTAQQSGHQVHYSEQVLRQHVDKAFQRIHQLDVVLQEVLETGQRTQTSRQQLQEQIDEVVQKLQEHSDQQAQYSSLEQQEQHPQHLLQGQVENTLHQLGQMDERIQQMEQQTQASQEQLQQQISKAVQRTDDLWEQKQMLHEVLQEILQTGQGKQGPSSFTFIMISLMMFPVSAIFWVCCCIKFLKD